MVFWGSHNEWRRRKANDGAKWIHQKSGEGKEESS
jgi:hypothetical protein